MTLPEALATTFPALKWEEKKIHGNAYYIAQVGPAEFDAMEYEQDRESLGRLVFRFSGALPAFEWQWGPGNRADKLDRARRHLDSLHRAVGEALGKA